METKASGEAESLLAAGTPGQDTTPRETGPLHAVFLQKVGGLGVWQTCRAIDSPSSSWKKPGPCPEGRNDPFAPGQVTVEP